MDFGVTTSGETGMRWLQAAMIVCFASAAGVMAYAITTSHAASSAAVPGEMRAAQQN